MSKCSKVKNPCKICLGSVSPKTGIQCQGACQTWVHFTCLNYTPGKIRDIKAGVIKVTCPCPDCKTTLPKEFRTDLPYSCNNSQCPANRPPKCDNNACPINGRKGVVAQPIGPPCPLSKCGNDCKQFSTPQMMGSGSNTSALAPPCKPPDFGSPNDICLMQRCPSGCSSTDTIGGTFTPAPMSAPTNINVMQQMCNTVNQLSHQINELMSQMKRGPQNQKGSCAQQGPKDMCPKPCFCPGNPRR